jgi:hypothetical protein
LHGDAVDSIGLVGLHRLGSNGGGGDVPGSVGQAPLPVDDARAFFCSRHRKVERWREQVCSRINGSQAGSLSHAANRYLVATPDASATSSERSRTSMVSSSDLTFIASVIMVMQNGHPVATVSGLAAVS